MTISVAMSIRWSVLPHGIIRLSLDGFSLNVIFFLFFENLSRRFEIHQNLKRITATLYKYLCIFFVISHSFLLRMRNVSNQVAEKLRTHILCSVTCFRKPCRFRDNMEKPSRARQATDDIITHAHCMLVPKATNT
jgi:hypothetical protein